MYYRYFGLQEAPFSIAVNPRYLFMSARHRDALAHLLYGVGAGGGFILLTGEVGTGKTTINRRLLEQLPENIDIALVLNPALNAVELLATVCDELRIEYDSGEQSLKILTDKLHQFLLTNHANDRNTVLLIDEAQHLTFDVLEQIRLLTNLETNTKKLLQIILVGQPELRSLLNQPELRQLAQRITARYQLKPLNLAETQAYIQHRLQVAGLPANQEIFPAKIIKAIHKTTRGVPRIINVLCDRMLLGCYGKNKTLVDKAIFKQATQEVMGEEEELQLQRSSRLLPHTAITGLLMVLVFMLIWWQLPKQIQSQHISAAQSAPFTQKPVSIIDPANINTMNSPANHQVNSHIWFDNQQQAIDEIRHAINWQDQPDPCANGKSLTLHCEHLTVKSWQDLLSYNRPAVLTLITLGKQQVYVALLAVDNQQATISYLGKRIKRPLDQLGTLWTGEFLFLWQSGKEFSQPLAEGDTGPLVEWLAQQFAVLDKQQTPLANQSFTPQLTQRITIFQQRNGLDADGIVGMKTLLKLNEQRGNAITLDQTPPAPQPPSQRQSRLPLLDEA